VNTASVSCSPVGFPNILTAEASHSVDLFQPAIDIVKTGDGYSKNWGGQADEITYKVTIKNTSSTDSPDLYLARYSDARLPVEFATPEGCKILPAGGSCSFSYQYTPTVEEGKGTALDNTFSAVYKPEGFPNEITDNDGSNAWTVQLIHPSFTVAKACDSSEPVPQEGPADFKTTITNTGDVPLVVTADDGIGTFNLAAGVSKDFPYADAGPFTGHATVSNTVTASWVLPESYGLSNSARASAEASCRVGGEVSLLKLTSISGSTPAPHPEMSWTFGEFAGPHGSDGPGSGSAWLNTPLATDNTLGHTDGVLDFGSMNLDPLKTYTICEMEVPSGYTVEWKVDKNNDGIPETVVIPYNPNEKDSVPGDIGNRCFDFGAGTSYGIPAGGKLAFQATNSYPGGAPRTPGYWKNWNRCTGGGQQYTADDNGGREMGFTLLEDVLNDPGITWDDILTDSFTVPITQCEQAIAILDQRVVVPGSIEGKKLASDAARTLAMHLLAAQLNEGNGACINQEVKDVVLSAETLLDKINFDGKKTTAYLTTKSGDYAYALSLAAYLDAYNNSDCDFTTLPAKPGLPTAPSTPPAPVKPPKK
jgi:hypothetical protein